MKRGQVLTFLRDDKSPLQSPNTRIVAGALIAGAKFANERPLLDVIENTEAGPKRTVTWVMDGSKTIEFKPDFEAEEIGFEEFKERFESLEWCEANADHPIAYMRGFSDMMNRLREKVQTMKPMLLVRRGRRTALIPADSTPDRKAEILSML
jgi:hypothetical protein